MKPDALLARMVANTPAPQTSLADFCSGVASLPNGSIVYIFRSSSTRTPIMYQCEAGGLVTPDGRRVQNVQELDLPSGFPYETCVAQVLEDFFQIGTPWVHANVHMPFSKRAPASRENIPEGALEDAVRNDPLLSREAKRRILDLDLLDKAQRPALSERRK